jgi:voltage-gated potassium channel
VIGDDGRDDQAMTSEPRRRLDRRPRLRDANLVERRMTKFLRQPPSIRLAASVIVTATLIIVVGGGILIRVIDYHEYSSVWVGMWWALQTVTTVGYGDVTPKAVSGRLVGALVMLEGVAFVAIITAAITSSFVARAQSERAEAVHDEALTHEQRLERRLDDLAKQLRELQSMVRELGQREG